MSARRLLLACIVLLALLAPASEANVYGGDPGIWRIDVAETVDDLPVLLTQIEEQGFEPRLSGSVVLREQPECGCRSRLPGPEPCVCPSPVFTVTDAIWVASRESPSTP